MNKKKIYPQWFLILPLALYIIFFLLPSIMGVAYSFTDWNSRSVLNGVHFVGLDNFKEIFTSNKDYLSGIGNTLKFTIISNIVKLIPALLIAIMLQEGLKGKGLEFVREICKACPVPVYAIGGINMERLPQVLINVKVSREGKLSFYTDREIKAEIERVSEILGDRGRILVRVSGTEPLVRVMLEGENLEEIQNLAEEAAQVVRERLA